VKRSAGAEEGIILSTLWGRYSHRLHNLSKHSHKSATSLTKLVSNEGQLIHPLREVIV
jgi:hypothetical protein